jgi:hypothetical protein
MNNNLKINFIKTEWVALRKFVEVHQIENATFFPTLPPFEYVAFQKGQDVLLIAYLSKNLKNCSTFNEYCVNLKTDDILDCCQICLNGLHNKNWLTQLGMDLSILHD